VGFSALSSATLNDAASPAAIVDRGKLRRNCGRMTRKAAQNGVDLRPHLKTAKAIEVARIASAGNSGGLTVSTLAEAEYFTNHGFLDLTYAVGLAPDKVAPISQLLRSGAEIKVITDNASAVKAIRDNCEQNNIHLSVLIEVDCGEGRGGVPPSSPALLDVAKEIANTQWLSLAGVLTHAGHSYHGKNASEIYEIAEQERRAAVHAAVRLREHGHTITNISIGSTPSVTFAQSFEGVTEIRAGVYTFGDLQQVSLGTCSVDDIALSILATVIGHNATSNRIIVDAGSLALSLAESQTGRPGYGKICSTSTGALFRDLYVSDIYQEHGLIAAHSGVLPFDSLPVGSRIRILPNHACLAASHFDSYLVVDNSSTIVDLWDKTRGWSCS